MTTWDDQLSTACAAWSRWCHSIEETGLTALRNTITRDEVDLAEGLRHLGRMVWLTQRAAFENADPRRPYLARPLGPDQKMGGDNPQGLYLSAPINGTDTFVLRGTLGSPRWLSFLSSRSPEGLAAGLSVFGNALFGPDLQVEPDGTFELVLSPDAHPGNWLQTDRYSSRLAVRQFFGTSEDVRPMDLTIENMSSGEEPPAPLTLDDAVAAMANAAGRFGSMVPAMVGELAAKADWINAFKTDIGDPTSKMGGVPGGNAVTSRWKLEPHEALIVHVTPPNPCAYWDAQVGNGWYESWDYRHRFSGLTCESACLDADGSVTLVVADRDPGTQNWLEAAGHREGHLAIRWQLTAGNLPIPDCSVVDVTEVASQTGLPAVGPDDRLAQRAALRRAFDARFRP